MPNSLTKVKMQEKTLIKVITILLDLVKALGTVLIGKVNQAQKASLSISVTLHKTRKVSQSLILYISITDIY